MTKTAGIVEVVSEHIKLEKQGVGWIGMCPKCECRELAVSSAKQIFFCFGCREGGGVYSFLRLINAQDNEPLEGLGK